MGKYTAIAENVLLTVNMEVRFQGRAMDDLLDLFKIYAVLRKQCLYFDINLPDFLSGYFTMKYTFAVCYGKQ